MGVRRGHSISPDQVEDPVVREAMFRQRLVFEGACGEKFTIALKHWPALRASINKAARQLKANPDTRRVVVEIRQS